MRMTKSTLIGTALVAATVAGCASMMAEPDRPAQAIAMMKQSFKPHGQAKLDRIEQDETQRLCSEYHAGVALPADVAEKIQRTELANIRYPADGHYLGNWKAGEKVAQSGRGLQYSDDPKQEAGGNCYACHQLTEAEVSYGTIGPSLLHFGRTHGFTPAMQKYAYGKVYNSEAYAACSNMPRFGHNGILTEQQIKDVVALLMDPDSPVNR
jgi:L-cysteine S-thiosulfotransferase